MQKVYNPIKRSKHLAALSREHHEGLLFVWKIKQGISYGVPATRIGSFCDWFWNTDLKQHFAKEESVISQLLVPTDALYNTMIEDHNAISQKMREVIEDPGYRNIQRLAQILYYHIRFEERSLFNHLEEMISDEELEEAVRELATETKKAGQWTDEFWVKSRVSEIANLSQQPTSHLN